MTTDVALRAEHIGKTFGAVRALSEVSVQVRRGEVHALAGGNGSGKSTLIKILAGVYQGDPGGRVAVNGRTVASDAITPEWARQVGMRFVHQDLGLFEHLTVAETVFTGSAYPHRFGRIDWVRLRRAAGGTLDRLNVRISPKRLVSELRPAERTLVAIARAVHEGARDGHVLVLDEPTAPLPAAEVDTLLTAVRQFAAAGEAIVYVSHRLDEVLDVCDRVTVLRDGLRVAQRDVRTLDHATLVSDIVGRSMEALYPEMPDVPDSTPLLSVRDLTAGPLRGISFAVRPREVLGIAGLVGSGRTTLLETLFGARARTGGEIRVAGETVVSRSPADAIRAGFAYVPENRARDGAFLDLGVPENMSAADLRRYWRGGRFRHRRERVDAGAAITDMAIRCPSVTAVMRQLSGGNQQKVMLERWLRRDSRILLLDEPTQGVDVGSRAEIYDHIRRAVAGGSAAVVVSSDFDELAHVSDRVLVLSGGRIVAERTTQLNRNWIAHQVFVGTASGAQR